MNRSGRMAVYAGIFSCFAVCILIPATTRADILAIPSFTTYTQNGASVFTINLGPGNNNPEVKTLQTALKYAGFFTYPSITGYYGSVTETAVKAFQRSKGIVSYGTPATTGYGFVGPKTRAALNQLTGDTTALVQTYLITLGYLPSYEKTGTYDILTETAFEAFQKQAGLTVTGIVDHHSYLVLELHYLQYELKLLIAKLPPGSALAIANTSNASSTSTTATTTATTPQVIYHGGGGGSSSLVTPADTTAPSVSITAPAASSTASGTTTITASASDNVAVSSVSFYDGSTLIGTDTTSPYSVAWNTTAVSSGSHSLTAVAKDSSNNQTTSASVAVTVANGSTTSSITQYGITWTFDHSYQYGQFVDGDYWVVGPVTVNSVSPGWNGTTSGSMVDPAALANQGFDTRANYTYSATNRTTFPVTLSATSSLISTVGLTTCAAGGAEECIGTSSVLTVVSAPVPSNSFRPPYVAGSKPLWTTSDVNYGLLPGLPTPSGATLPNLSGIMVRPWIDFGPPVTNTTIHPDQNMIAYPGYNALNASRLADYVLTNEPDVDSVANRMIQNGIDEYAISLNNQNGWEAAGGFGLGRKWPILFAGLMLNSSAMQNVATTTNTPYTNNDKFGEDGHTYYGSSTAQYPAGKPLWGQDCASDGIGYPWFYNHDCRDPNGVLEPSQMYQGGAYQACCTSPAYVGVALAAERMHATSTWGHPAFFGYVDRWVGDPTLWVASSSAFYQDYYGYGGDGNGFMKAMWNTYRDMSPPILSSASGSTTGATIADLSVSTNEASGTLYWVVTTSATSPSAAQVKAGLNNLGTTAVASGSTVVSASGTQAVSVSGLTASTTYYAHFMHEDLGLNQSVVVTSASFTTTPPDVTPPTLSNPIAAPNGAYDGTGSVDTNESNGTLYWVVTTSATSPSAAQVKAGQNAGGSAAADSGSQVASTTGTQTVSGGFTGLTGGTTYYVYYMQEDASTNQSSVAAAGGFTTAAELAASWAFTGSATGWTLGSGWSYGNGQNRVNYASGTANAKVQQTIAVSTSTPYRLLADVGNITAANGDVIVTVAEQNGASPKTSSTTVPLSALGVNHNTIPIVFTTAADCTSVTISVQPDNNTAAFSVSFMSLLQGNELILDPEFVIQAAGTEFVWNAPAVWNLTAGDAHYSNGSGYDTMALVGGLWLSTSTNYTLRVTFSEVASSTGSFIGRMVSNNTISTTLSSVTSPQTLSGAETPASHSAGMTVFPTNGTANFRIAKISLQPT